MNDIRDDEVDLYDLYLTLRKKLRWIITITLFLLVTFSLLLFVLTEGSTRNVIAISFIMSVMISFFIVFLIEFFDNSIKTRTDVLNHLNLEVMGSIPKCNSGFRGTDQKTLLDSNSFLAESYQMLATNIISNHDKNKKVFVTTAATPNEGTTSTAVNIAISMANRGRKVILLDCNFRKPNIHNILDLPQDEGISEVISKREDFHGYLKKTNIENLSVLSAGLRLENPVKVLDDKHLESILTGLKEIYDFVIIDTPPSSLFTDASILCRYSDGCLFVYCSEKVDKEIARKGVKAIEMTGSKISGVVLNKLPLISQENIGSFSDYDYYKQ